MFVEGNSFLLRGYYLIKLTFLLAKALSTQVSQGIISQKFGELASGLVPAILHIERWCSCQLSLVTHSDLEVHLGA